MTADRATGPGIWQAYRLRLKRRRLLWRAFRSRHQLKSMQNRTGAIAPGDILLVMVVRNEALRLPYFLDYYRRLGVAQFLVVDNDSTDDTAPLLAAQPDVSLWSTKASYRAARFGLDWASWLLMRYGHGHWCLLLDADELLVYPHCDSRDLKALTGWLDRRRQPALGALMLDLCPQGPVGEGAAAPGADPLETLNWFDPGPYRALRQRPMQNLWVQGGVRERVFFPRRPRRSPTLNKLPLIRWNRRWAFVNSCHSILPPQLNLAYSGPGGIEPSGVLLHTKFLPDVTARAAEDQARQQHFNDPQSFSGYYDAIAEQPVLWSDQSLRYEGWRQLAGLGLMSSGGW